MGNVIGLGKRVFMIFAERDGPPIGTGFNLEKPGLVLTAAHVVENQDRVLVVNTSGEKLRIVRPVKIVPHPSADVAAILLPDNVWEDAEHFRIGSPPEGFSDFPLGTEVASYGYPLIAGEKPVYPRLMKGHIQRKFEYRRTPYHYQSFEFGFPAFGGQSGSPVFLDDVGYPDPRNQTVGIVTESVVIGTGTAEEMSSIRWATGASLIPLQGWIQRLPECT